MQRDPVQRRLDGQGEQQRRAVARHAWSPVAETASFVVVAALLAARAPLVASVVGLMVLGIMHNVMELRYVLARWSTVFAGSFRVVVLAMVTVIAIGRLAGPAARSLEVVVGLGILAAGLIWSARERPTLCALGLPVVAVGAVVGLLHLDYYFVAVTYVHNLVPFVFLWDWAARHLTGATRAAFSAVQVCWLLVVPALFLTGAVPVPGVEEQASAVEFAGPVAGHVATAAPPAWRDAQGARLLAVFAFLQVLHYIFWCWFLPRRGGLERPAGRPPWLRRTGWTVAALVGTVFAVGYATAWATTKVAYVSLASYHAYIEYAVLCIVILRPSPKEVPAP